jgi:hypothetical protein
VFGIRYPEYGIQPGVRTSYRQSTPGLVLPAHSRRRMARLSREQTAIIPRMVCEVKWAVPLGRAAARYSLPVRCEHRKPKTEN